MLEEFPHIQERWNDKMKVLIIGGVAGGATAAARIRRLDEQAEITVFERSGYISYANCGLPYYIGGVITDPEDLTLQTPESFFARFRINMKVHHEVLAIDPDRKKVRVKNLKSGEEFEEAYDKLILSPGAKPNTAKASGGWNKKGIYFTDSRRYIPYERVYCAESAEVCCIGRWWFYWSGAGGKFKRAWHGCDDCTASETADESF